MTMEREKRLTCQQADERYTTARMMGAEYGGAPLIDHAEHCERGDWHHALPTLYRPLAEANRKRRREYEAWRQPKQSHPESGAHDLGCGCDSCYGYTEVTR